MKSLKALITKDNLNKASISPHIFEIPLKKSNLQNGDLVQQRDGDIGIYIGDLSEKDSDNFNLQFSGGFFNQIIIFASSGNRKFLHYPISYYTNDLEDKDRDIQYDAVKIVRGLYDPKNIRDAAKVYAFLKNESNYKRYFKDEATHK